MPLSQGDVCLSCPDVVELGVLLPHLAGVIVEEVAVAAGLLLVIARARAGTAACPACGTASSRVHSRYSRRLADAAIGGRRVEICLAVRRFFCPAAGCKRKIFAEQVEGLTTRYARKTPPLAAMLRNIAVALAGRAASRLAGCLGVPASRQVLLRLVMATPDPEVGAPRVQVDRDLPGPAVAAGHRWVMTVRWSGRHPAVARAFRCTGRGYRGCQGRRRGHHAGTARRYSS